MNTFVEFVVLGTKLWWPAWVTGGGFYLLCTVSGALLNRGQK